MRDFTHQLQITVTDDGLLSYGQRVYVVARENYKSFTEKCPICDDAKKIIVRGMEFDCPYCRGYRSDRKATTIELYNYVVDEYIINRIEIKGEEVRGAYNKDGSVADRRYPSASYSGFTKKGNGHNSTETKNFCGWNFEPHDPNKPVINRDLGGEYCFLKKADAAAFAKRLHERQAEWLAEFNAEHGTDHAYPFEY